MEFAPWAPAAIERAIDLGDPSLILLSDINMPGMSGLEMLPEVRAKRPNVPVIMITAYGDAETRKGDRAGRGRIVNQADRLFATASGDRHPARTGRMTTTVLFVDDEPDLEALVLQKFRRQIREGAVKSCSPVTASRRWRRSSRSENRHGGERHRQPRMDGLSLLARLQEAEDADRKSTVIVSAYGDMSNIPTAMNRGAFDFLTKPIDFGDLENRRREDHS